LSKINIFKSENELVYKRPTMMYIMYCLWLWYI